MLSPSLWGLPLVTLAEGSRQYDTQQCFPHLYGGCPPMWYVDWLSENVAAMLSPSLWGLPRPDPIGERPPHRAGSNAFPIFMGVAPYMSPEPSGVVESQQCFPHLYGGCPGIGTAPPGAVCNEQQCF